MVQVNLLPPEIAQQRQALRRTVWSVALLGVWILVVGGVYVLKLSEVHEARMARDTAQAHVTALQADVAELQRFRVLADRLAARNGLLAAAMADELSWARVLNDVALAFPSNASLLTLDAAVVTENPAAAPTVAEPDFGDAVAKLSFTGYSVERLAPGVESVLVDFADARGFFHSELTTAAEAQIGDTQVTNFAGSVDLGRQLRTRRYADGLPSEVTP